MSDAVAFSSMSTFYHVLGIPSTASTGDVKDAYRRCLLATHPDKVGDNSASSTLIARIQEAYTALCDPVRRAEYDAMLANSVKQQGFILTGDGLDTYTLDSFEESEYVWRRHCPRCQSRHSIELSEQALEQHGTPDGCGGYEVIVQCSSCSLWIKVLYEEGHSELE